MVYIDDMNAPFGRMIMCHMIADSEIELIEMATRIGVAARWIQKEGTPQEHFDVCLSAKEKAIKLGAIAISQRELAYKIRDKRNRLKEGGKEF